MDTYGVCENRGLTFQQMDRTSPHDPQDSVFKECVLQSRPWNLQLSNFFNFFNAIHILCHLTFLQVVGWLRGPETELRAGAWDVEWLRLRNQEAEVDLWTRWFISDRMLVRLWQACFSSNSWSYFFEFHQQDWPSMAKQYWEGTSPKESIQKLVKSP